MKRFFLKTANLAILSAFLLTFSVGFWAVQTLAVELDEEGFAPVSICHWNSENEAFEETLVTSEEDLQAHENHPFDELTFPEGGCGQLPPPQVSADLVMSKNVDEPQPNIGGVVTFGLSVTNQGPFDAQNVSVSDALPSGFAFVSASPSSAYNSSTGVWTIGDLADGETVFLDIIAQAQAGAGDTTQVNSALVTSDTFDPVLANNTAEVSVEIGVPQKPVCVAGENYASYVYFHIRGTRKDGGIITDTNITNSTHALGSPDQKIVSMGKNGVIKLGFANFVMDVPGEDFRVYEVSGDDDVPESAKVEISQDGATWFTVGTAGNGVTAFDMSSSGLSWFEFIKISDSTDFTEHPDSGNGFDLDAVGVEYQACVVGTLRKSADFDAETNEILYTLSWGLYGQGNLNLSLSDKIPSGTDYVTDSANAGGVYDAGDKTITWDLGDKSGGQSGSVSFKVVVQESWTCPVTNIAELMWGLNLEEETFAKTTASVKTAVSDDSEEDCSKGGGNGGGVSQNLGSITGVVFNDANNNGSLDEGEEDLSGWVVFLDTNDNGSLDEGETKTTTASPYLFSGLVDGTYTVRQVTQNTWTQTLPNAGSSFKYSVQIAGGAQVTGKHFGNFQVSGSGGGTGGGGGSSTTALPQVLGDSTNTQNTTGGQGGVGENSTNTPQVLGTSTLPRTGSPVWVSIISVIISISFLYVFRNTRISRKIS